VNKKELIDIVARKSGMTKIETESLLTITLETIVDTVAKGDRVTLVGFGSFEARERKERYGRNPRTGEKLYIPAARIPTFSVGNFFKNKVANEFNAQFDSPWIKLFIPIVKIKKTNHFMKKYFLH